jgi:hypothetical protein
MRNAIETLMDLAMTNAYGFRLQPDGTIRAYHTSINWRADKGPGCTMGELRDLVAALRETGWGAF